MAKYRNLSIEQLREIVVQQLEKKSCKKSDINQMCDGILNIMLNEHKSSCFQKTNDYAERQNKRNEQIKDLRADRVTYKKVFIKDSREHFDELKIIEEKLKENGTNHSNEFLQIDTMISSCIKSAGEINAQIEPVIKEIEDVSEKTRLLLEVDKLKIDSIKSMICGCFSLNKDTMELISMNEEECNRKQQLLENMQKREKAYKLIPDLEKELCESQTKFSQNQKLIKIEIIDIANSKRIKYQCSMDIKSEKFAEKSLKEGLKALQTKRNMIKDKGIVPDDFDVTLIDLSKYQKEQKNIQKLKSDKEQILVDIDKVNKETVKLEKQLAIGTVININELEKKLEALQKIIDDSKKELENVVNEKANIQEEVNALYKEKNAINLEIRDLAKTLSKSNQTTTNNSTTIETESKTPDAIQSDTQEANTAPESKKQKLSIAKEPIGRGLNDYNPDINLDWLDELPPRLHNSRASLNISQMEIENDSIIYRHFNLDVPNPETMFSKVGNMSTQESFTSEITDPSFSKI